MSNDIDKVISLGQYVYWSRLQYDSFRSAIESDKPNTETLGKLCHWLASLFVVIEGWEEIDCNSERINKLLSCCSEYKDALRRCRNAVYHYQKKILDKRIQQALSENELTTWAMILQDEFECYIYSYPFQQFGLCPETYDLQNEILGSIGWIPNNHLVEWYDLYLLCLNYIYKNEVNKLDINTENDLKIIECWKTLESLRDHEVDSFLT